MNGDLAGYEWVTVDGIKVARPKLRAAPDAPLTDADVAQMTACPTCLAKVHEQCRTTSGNSTEHALRLIPRRCRCGALLAPRHKHCETCAEIARRQTYYRREVTTPTQLRRRKRVA